ncbi:hypothetical protein FQN50_001709 [Emmonsiellopsis sp. PD_5]|nr:hypothetical protein FQN50_001709 [Emmonsiellopsis sp. PD_5]
MKLTIVNVVVTALLLAAGTVEAACSCKEGFKQGQYCGYCYAVNSGISDHVYECNPQGGCLHYGFRQDCADGKFGCPF